MMNIKPAANRLRWGECLCVGAVDQSCYSGLRLNRISFEALNNEIVSLASLSVQYVAAAAAGTEHKSGKAASVN